MTSKMGGGVGASTPNEKFLLFCICFGIPPILKGLYKQCNWPKISFRPVLRAPILQFTRRITSLRALVSDLSDVTEPPVSEIDLFKFAVYLSKGSAQC